MPLCRRIAWALILALVFCALPCWAAAEPEESAPAMDTVYINVTNAQIYHKPSTRAKKYVRLSYGDSLYLKNYNSSWAELTDGTRLSAMLTREIMPSANNLSDGESEGPAMPIVLTKD